MTFSPAACWPPGLFFGGNLVVAVEVKNHLEKPEIIVKIDKDDRVIWKITLRPEATGGRQFPSVG
jgi:hypothetical protein